MIKFRPHAVAFRGGFILVPFISTATSSPRSVAWLVVASGLILARDAWCADPVQFQDQIAPLVKRHCVKCHGPAKQEGGLNLSTANGLIRGGSSGAAITSHDLEASLIWKKISADEMPPENPLTEAEKSLIKRWIVEGTTGLSRSEEESEHWAFRSLAPKLWADIEAVKIEAPSSASTHIDRFLLARLQQEGLSFLPEADRYAQIRRVSFDLTGLPPSPEEIDEFVHDPNPDAYDRMVDRYLASPHFGERLGKVWLDATGYADSNGYFNADTDRPLAYRFRDYVIRSLNADKPFHEFIREQIAGDELASLAARMGDSIVLPVTNKADKQTALRTTELWDATHFLRNGQDGTGESDGNPDEVRVDRYTVVETAMQNMSTALLGMTIQCAKCHDHKFEPLTQRDYYSLQAILIPAFPPENWKKPNERFIHASPQDELDNWQTQLAAAESNVSQLRTEVDAWVQANRPHGKILFSDPFEGSPETLLAGWSNIAPGDDKPGGTAAVNLNSRQAPAAAVNDGHLQLIEGGPGGDKWLTTRESFDWSPDAVGASIQVTFDLVDNRVDNSSAAERIGYFIATHDFHNRNEKSGGDILIDGNPSTGSEVDLDYPGERSKRLGTLGKTGYTPGRNYGVRVTNLGDGKFQLQHLVDSQIDEPTLKLSESDLPPGGFGFEYCCGRSFIVDNVVVETFSAAEEIGRLSDFVKELNSRRAPLTEAAKAKSSLENNRPGKIAWTTDLVDPPPAVHIFERGNYATPGQPVEPAGYSILTEKGDGAPLAVSPIERSAGHKSSGRRLAFANWLTAPDSKPAALMARVQVNRFWQQMFGAGLVASVDNFGMSGSPPTHRQLVDWLAAEFVSTDWSTKRIVRSIANSSAYRQSSLRTTANTAEGSDTDPRWQRDPDGRLLSRFPLRRLDAESIRDMLLASSGGLDDRMYGAYTPTSHTGDGETVAPEDKPGSLRRSIYLQQKRTQVHSLLQVFDAPSIVFNSTRRARSTMPLQSLSLLNSEFAVARAKQLARELDSCSGDESQLLDRALLRTTGRPATKKTLAAMANFLREQRSEYAAESDATLRAWTDLCQMLLVENAALYLE